MEDERLVFLSTSSHGDGVRQQIEKVLEQRSNTFNAILRQAPTIDDAIALLNDGVGDLVAMSPENWNLHQSDNLAIVGLLSRREPTWVLVSDDKPEYLIKHARIVCQHPLIQRQMLRLRQDLNLLEKEDVDVRLETDSREEIERLEELRLGGEIDGYVVKRSQYNLLSAKRVDIRSDCRKDRQSARTLFLLRSMDSRLLLDVLVFQSREWNTFLTPLLSLPIELKPLYWKVFQAISSNLQEFMLSNVVLVPFFAKQKKQRRLDHVCNDRHRKEGSRVGNTC